MLNKDFYIEIAYNSHREMGQTVCGSEFLQKGYPGHQAIVLCNGGGSGFKSNVIASVMASMAVTHTTQTPSLIEVGRTVFSAFISNKENNPSITVIKIDNKSSEESIIEFGNPLAVIFEGNEEKEISRNKVDIILENKKELSFLHTTFPAKVEDRIIFFNSGVEKSGYATAKMPNGWGSEEIIKNVKALILEEKAISAMSLSNTIVDTSQENDLDYPKSDMCCGSIYFRHPRKLMVCTGPPYDMQNDAVIAKLVDSYDGDVVICGGSTSQIISRELGKDLYLLKHRDVSGLPSCYTMDGIKLVTEGVITLARVKSVLEKLKDRRAKGEGLDIRFINEFLDHDLIDFVVGTRINELHQNPNIPIELELRRSVVSEIARILEVKYMKAVTKRYF